MNPGGLKFKVSIYLVLALTVAVVLFTFLVVRNNREELLNQAISHAAQLTGVVMKTTRFAMQHVSPGDVDRILSEVGAHEDTAPVLAPEATVNPARRIRKVEMPRCTTASTSVRAFGSAASRNLSGNGNVSTHCLTGTSGNT